MKAKVSSSQYTFRREDQALVNMPKQSGRAACEGDKSFDILLDKNRVPRNVRNDLARVCAVCVLNDCGWRQTRELPSGYVTDEDA